MIRTLYTLLAYLAAPLVVLRLYWRSLSLPAYRRRIKERFGFPGTQSAPRGCIWVHAVSVGEINAAAPLIRRFLQREKGSVLVTNFTPTGAERTRQLFGDSVCQRMAPYDLPGSIRRFLSHTRPRALVVMETEIWPNLYHVVDAMNIPIALVNARMSGRSFRNYRRVRGLLAQSLGKLALLAAQSRADVEKFRQMGAPECVLKHAGNLKYDLDMPASAARDGRRLRHGWGKARPVFIAASTHDPEERTLINACAKLWLDYPRLLLILAPRHPQRCVQVMRLCKNAGLNPVSKFNAASIPASCRCLVVDVIGKLAQLFHASDLAFVGGSLIPHGGQNVLEASAAGVPVLTGPYCANFADISRALAQSGALEFVRDSSEIARRAGFWLSDTKARKRAGAAGMSTVAANRGATDRVWLELRAMLARHPF